MTKQFMHPIINVTFYNYIYQILDKDEVAFRPRGTFKKRVDWKGHGKGVEGQDLALPPLGHDQGTTVTIPRGLFQKCSKAWKTQTGDF